MRPRNVLPLNFFTDDARWLDAYTIAAANRGLRHGLLVRRETMAALQRLPDFELADVRVGHPHSFGVDDQATFWRFDIANHRYGALHVMQSSNVVRYAAPAGDQAQMIDIPHAEVIAWW